MSRPLRLNQVPPRRVLPDSGRAGPISLRLLNLLPRRCLERGLTSFFLNHHDLSVDLVLVDILIVSDLLLLVLEMQR